MIEKSLGRGLESLISRTGPQEGPTGQVVEIELDKIVPNPEQPRQIMDDAALRGLAESIRRHGVLQPVVVQRTKSGFQLIAGERRVRASRLAEKKAIRALVIEADANQSLEMALIENIQREDLTPLEEASAYEALLERHTLTHQELADRLGRGRATVSNALRLLDLPDTIKGLIQSGELSAGQARAVLGAGDTAHMEALAKAAARNSLPVREVERRVRDVKGRTRRRRAGPTGPMGEYEEQLRRLYGTRVVVNDKGGRGEIRFEFYTAEDRDRLLHVLMTGGGGDVDAAAD